MSEQVRSAPERNESLAIMSTIFDPDFSQVPRNEMYRAWVFPDLYPEEPQPVLSNWSDEDLEAYCGIYTSERRWDLEDHSPRYNGDLYPYEEGPFADPSN